MIIVTLTSLEKKALEMAGNASDLEAEQIIYIALLAKGMEGVEAQQTARTLGHSAARARRKITEATCYEIQVVDE